MTTVHKKRHGGIRRWLVRNSLNLALIGIILLSMTAGAIGCLAFLPKPQNISTPETKTDVSTATVMQPDINGQFVMFEFEETTPPRKLTASSGLSYRPRSLRDFIDKVRAIQNDTCGRE